MTNILYISTTSQIGGGPEHLDSLLRGLDREKYFPIVAAPDNGEYFDRFGSRAEMIKLEKISSIAKNYKRLSEIVRDKQIDIVHSHGRGAGIYSRMLKIKYKGLKVVHTFHGIYYENGKTISRTLRILSDQALKKYTDAFICVSNKEKQDAVCHGFSDEYKTYVIYNGIDANRFDIDIDRDKYRESIGIEKNDYVIGYVARLCETKGHRELIEAFAEYVKDNVGSKLLLVGDGDDMASLKELSEGLEISDKVIFLGTRRDVPQLLKCMDVFVSASHKEGMPYNLLEALAAGVPVVATDVTGNSEIIKEGYNGMLCKAKDARDICRALTDMKKLDSLKKENYIANGIKIIEESFSAKRTSEETQKIYDRLLH